MKSKIIVIGALMACILMLVTPCISAVNVRVTEETNVPNSSGGGYLTYEELLESEEMTIEGLLELYNSGGPAGGWTILEQLEFVLWLVYVLPWSDINPIGIFYGWEYKTDSEKIMDIIGAITWNVVGTFFIPILLLISMMQNAGHSYP